MQGSTPVIIASAERVHQGDPLGPILFASAIHSDLINLQEEHSRVCFLAYLDDVFIMGHPSDIQPAFQALKQKFSAIGLSIADHKCEIYCPSSSASLKGFDNTSVSHNGIIILGTLIGTKLYVVSSCLNISESNVSLCDEFVKLGDVQSAMLLLRGCHVPCLNHLARSICPESLTEAAKTHDSQTRMTFCSILGLDLIEDRNWHQAVLPIRLGGFGMSSLATVSQPASVASWCHATAELALCFASLISAIDSLVISPRQALGKALTQSIPVRETVSSLLSSTGKIQHSYTHLLLNTRQSS